MKFTMFRSSQDASVKEVLDIQTKLTSIRETLPQPNKSGTYHVLKL